MYFPILGFDAKKRNDDPEFRANCQRSFPIK